MKFSVIIPSTMKDYKTAARGRRWKIFRAIESVLLQSFNDYEIIVVADGCEETFKIIEESYSATPQVRCYHVEKSMLWSGGPRNFGIVKAVGEYIIYLDIDDYWGKGHLEVIASQLQLLNNPAWIWFNDHTPQRNLSGVIHWTERNCNINKRFSFGTSNLCHRRDLNVLWTNTGYEHDFHFGNALKDASSNYHKIETPDYRVCHLYKKFDI